MPSTAPGNDLDLSRRDVADILKVSVKTLAEWERRGSGPTCYRLSPKVTRYSRADVEAFKIAARKGSAIVQPQA